VIHPPLRPLPSREGNIYSLDKHKLPPAEAGGIKREEAEASPTLVVVVVELARLKQSKLCHYNWKRGQATFLSSFLVTYGCTVVATGIVCAIIKK